MFVSPLKTKEEAKCSVMKSNSQNNDETLSAGRVSRIIQIHPSLQCNLACQHCYSGSAPHFRGGLEVQQLKDRITQLEDVGYNVISLSGGEPFMYRPLLELLEHSKSLGFFNSITTNGMLLKSDHSKKILKLADLVAISVDGKPARHDELRGQKGAFEKMLEGIRIVQNHVPNFGFIHTVFPDSWQILPWLVNFALEQKGKLLHLHPLEIAGRAEETLSHTTFDACSLHKIYIAFHYLKNYYAGELFMQLDLLHRDNIIDNPNFIFHQTNDLQLEVNNFSNIFKEIIIDEKGDIIPIAHGCSPFCRIGNIYQDLTCRQMIDNFMEYKMEELIHLYSESYYEILSDENQEIFNWSEIVINRSHTTYDKLIAFP